MIAILPSSSMVSPLLGRASGSSAPAMRHRAALPASEGVGVAAADGQSRVIHVHEAAGPNERPADGVARKEAK
jgi:hypothetical protein